jgi:hypothetical protein
MLYLQVESWALHRKIRRWSRWEGEESRWEGEESRWEGEESRWERVWYGE